MAIHQKKYQVFISSTYSDMLEERQAAVSAILDAGHIPAGMELFAAGDEAQWDVIKRWIDESDIYMLLLGGRYGSVDPKTGISYTEMEYEYAVQTHKPFFQIVLSDKRIESKIFSTGNLDLGERFNPGLLRNFRGKVTSRMVSFADDTKDIRIAIPKAIRELEKQRQLVGWIRADVTVSQTDSGASPAKTQEPAIKEKLRALFAKINPQIIRDIDQGKAHTEIMLHAKHVEELEDLMTQPGAKRLLRANTTGAMMNGGAGNRMGSYINDLLDRGTLQGYCLIYDDTIRGE